jgi:DNA-binding response OmpR family regulator
MVEDNAFRIHVSNLRKELKQYDNENEYIETVLGIGFKLKD